MVDVEVDKPLQMAKGDDRLLVDRMAVTNRVVLGRLETTITMIAHTDHHAISTMTHIERGDHRHLSITMTHTRGARLLQIQAYPHDRQCQNWIHITMAFLRHIEIETIDLLQGEYLQWLKEHQGSRHNVGPQRSTHTYRRTRVPIRMLGRLGTFCVIQQEDPLLVEDQRYRHVMAQIDQYQEAIEALQQSTMIACRMMIT